MYLWVFFCNASPKCWSMAPISTSFVLVNSQCCTRRVQLQCPLSFCMIWSFYLHWPCKLPKYVVLVFDEPIEVFGICMRWWIPGSNFSPCWFRWWISTQASPFSLVNLGGKVTLMIYFIYMWSRDQCEQQKCQVAPQPSIWRTHSRWLANDGMPLRCCFGEMFFPGDEFPLRGETSSPLWQVVANILNQTGVGWFNDLFRVSCFCFGFKWISEKNRWQSIVGPLSDPRVEWKMLPGVSTSRLCEGAAKMEVTSGWEGNALQGGWCCSGWV